MIIMDKYIIYSLKNTKKYSRNPLYVHVKYYNVIMEIKRW